MPSFKFENDEKWDKSFKFYGQIENKQHDLEDIKSELKFFKKTWNWNVN
jgi:hypothetical protein